MNDPIVLIHGLFHGLTHLREARFFAPEQVIVLDLLGYGEFAKKASSIDIAAQVRHVAAELGRRAISRAHLVGHSVGGVVAILVARDHPRRAASIVNVEGNFTLADAFWSSKVASMPLAGIGEILDADRADPAKWLERNKIAPTPERIDWTRRMFGAQPAATVHAMARSVVDVTERADYLMDIRAVLDAGTPVHLFAGERSRASWKVPAFALDRCASLTVQPAVGHMMPLEDPDGFLERVRGICRRA